MISWLKGTLIEKQPPMVVLDVSGVGYELEMPLNGFYDLPELSHEATIFVHMVVREDAQLLFGFSERLQRDLFRSLIKISGVGPKVALAVLSTLTPTELVSCANTGDVATLTRVPGIGAKTAQRMLVELKDKLGGDFADVVQSGESIQGDAKTEAVQALEALGYKTAEANKAVRGLNGDLSSEDIIRQALRILSGRVL